MLYEFVTVTFRVVIWWFVTPYILVHCLYWRQRYVWLPVERLSERCYRWFQYPGIWRCVRGWSERTVRRTYCLHLQGSIGDHRRWKQKFCFTFRIRKTRLPNFLRLFTLSPRIGSGIFVRNVGAPTSLHGVISTIMYTSHCITATIYGVLCDRKLLIVADMRCRFREINP